MAFKRANGYYYTEPKYMLRGYGYFPRISLNTKKKTMANAMENAIRLVYERGLLDRKYWAILDALKPHGKGKQGEISAQDVLVYQKELDELLLRLENPLIEEVMKRFSNPSRADKHAFKTIVDFVGGKRILYLRKSENIQALLEEIEQVTGNKRNSVIRYERRAISKLLRFQFGNFERDRIMSEVDFPSEDDTRRVSMDLEEINRLLSELDKGYQKRGDELARVYVEIALTTGCTISPLSKTENRQYQRISKDGLEFGLIELEKTKRIKGSLSGRNRPILIVPRLARIVERYYREEEPSKLLFPLVYSRFATMFKKARQRAGVEGIRPHDLRSIFSHNAERLGLTRTEISKALGHSRQITTDRYLEREYAMSVEDAIRLDLGQTG